MLNNGVVWSDPVFVFPIDKQGLKNFIGVTMICNNYVFITTSGADQESTTIISVEFTDGLIQYVELFFFVGWWDILLFRMFFMCALVWVLFIVSCLVRIFLGGSHSFRGLDHMYFYSLHWVWKIFSCIGVIQSWPCLKVSFFGCFKLCRFNCKSCCRMHIAD